tara:strand:- start:342 stop:1211 length:870 start_codon:yes stop_codon:yes gene_type:complete
VKNYLTLKDMGSSGGLCSQLQIYASMLAVAEANDMEIVFSEDMVKNIGVGIRIFDLLDLEYSIKPNNFFDEFINKPINFHTTRFDTSLFPLSPKGDYNLIGRFDLYTYWYNSISNKVAQWKFKPELQTQAEKRISEIKSKLGDKPTVSIHLRRGDYLLPQYSFCHLDSNYYLKAIIDNFQPIKDYNFIVFSNDIEYAKQIFSGDNIWFIEPLGGEKLCTDSEKEDLALLSLCDHHITANSSYSWWGAYLSKNPNKRIICPTNYLDSRHESSWINGSYYPPTWVNIDNKC